MTVNGVPTTVGYGQGDTNTGLASALAADLNNGTAVSASASGNVIYLTAKQSGANTNYSLSASSQSTNPDFGVASFSATPSGSTLTGGTDGHYAGGGTLYSDTSIGYAPDGDVLSSNDSAVGDFPIPTTI